MYGETDWLSFSEWWSDSEVHGESAAMRDKRQKDRLSGKHKKGTDKMEGGETL